MWTAHVEAHFESAHRNGPPGHKCAGTFQGVPVDVKAVLEHYGTAGENQPEFDAMLADLGGLLDYHGHSWFGIIEWSYDVDKLDEYGWGPDFGAVKELMRRYDHHNLNLFPDLKHASAENLSELIYDDFEITFGFAPDFVRLQEGAGNAVIYTR